MRERIWLLVLCLFFCGCYRQESAPVENPPVQSSPPPAVSNDKSVEDQTIKKIKAARQSVVSFFRPMGKPEPLDWLANNREPGQVFEEYLKSATTLPSAQRQTIYIQPIGQFTPTERRVIAVAADYMKNFYNLPVKLQPEKPLGSPPAKFLRRNQWSKQEQVQTAYFLDELLPAMIPADAAALICLTNSDLYPDEKWSFVFGMASLQKRVGVWSLYRLGNPDRRPADYQKFLRRTLKIAVHETGHMFSIKHCTKYECLMSGTNNLEETDRRPVDVCPECMAKIAWAMKYEPHTRYENLSRFWTKQTDGIEAILFTKKADAVKNICVYCR